MMDESESNYYYNSTEDDDDDDDIHVPLKRSIEFEKYLTRFRIELMKHFTQGNPARCQAVGLVPGSAGWGVIRLINRHRMDHHAHKIREDFHLLARVLRRRIFERLIEVVLPADDVEHRRKLQNTLLRYREWVNCKHVRSNRFPMFCFLLSVPEKELVAVIPDEQVIAWNWAIVFAFAVPECGAIFRSWRLCFFKSVRNFTSKELGIVLLFESLHVFGICLLAFKVLPELDVIQGAMLTNCLCFVPSIFCKTIFPSTWFMCLQHVMPAVQACCLARPMNPSERSSMFWTSDLSWRSWLASSSGRWQSRRRATSGSLRSRCCSCRVDGGRTLWRSAVR